MSNASLDACYDMRRQEVRKGLSDLYRKSGVPVDIGEWAVLILINAVMAMLWGGTLTGEKCESIGAEFRMVMAKFMVLLGSPNVSDLFPAVAWLDLQGVERDMKRIVLDMEMDLEDNQSPTDKNGALKAILTDIVIGGTDTTSTMVEWVMTELMQNRDVMNKVVHELTEVVAKDEMVEEHHLPKLKYLDAVIKEAFRLHPALPLFAPRMPRASCVIGGYTIPKGSNIFLNVGYIHRDPKIWDNPTEFRPERFLGDPSRYDFSGNNFMYMPFGSGRRRCAGLALGERMLTCVLASLMHSFEWELPPGTEMDFLDKFGIVVKKMKPPVVIPRPRLSTPELYMPA